MGIKNNFQTDVRLSDSYHAGRLGMDRQKQSMTGMYSPADRAS